MRASTKYGQEITVGNTLEVNKSGGPLFIHHPALARGVRLLHRTRNRARLEGAPYHAISRHRCFRPALQRSGTRTNFEVESHSERLAASATRPASLRVNGRRAR